MIDLGRVTVAEAEVIITAVRTRNAELARVLQARLDRQRDTLSAHAYLRVYAPAGRGVMDDDRR